MTTDAFLRSVLPPGTFGASQTGNAEPGVLHQEEIRYAVGWGDKRLREFALGRCCARAVLTEMGVSPCAIPRAPDGRPGWPAGTVGSITHTSDYVAAIATHDTRYRALGVDAERTDGMTEAVMALLFDDDERRSLDGADSANRNIMATLYFSAKESSFKAWSSVGSVESSLRNIHVDLCDGEFFANRASVPMASGRFAVKGDLVLTALGLTAV
jgi:4'-phosphopantetheinyl transferase EntD